jgi:multidrug efflux pump subunit AcrB
MQWGGMDSTNSSNLNINLEAAVPAKRNRSPDRQPHPPQACRHHRPAGLLAIPQSTRVGGRMQKASYDYTLYGPNTDQLYSEATQLERAVPRLPGLVDVTSELQIKDPRIEITIDDRPAALGGNWTNIANMLYDAFGPQLVSTIYAETNQYYRVLLEVLTDIPNS